MAISRLAFDGSHMAWDFLGRSPGRTCTRENLPYDHRCGEVGICAPELCGPELPTTSSSELRLQMNDLLRYPFSKIIRRAIEIKKKEAEGNLERKEALDEACKDFGFDGLKHFLWMRKFFRVTREFLEDEVALNSFVGLMKKRIAERYGIDL